MRLINLFNYCILLEVFIRLSLLLGANTGNLRSFILTLECLLMNGCVQGHKFTENVSINSDQRTLLRNKSCLKCQKWSPYKVKGALSSPNRARKQTNSPFSADQGFSTASYNSCHALSPRGVYPPTSPCPTLSASTEPTFKTDLHGFHLISHHLYVLCLMFICLIKMMP